MEFLGANRARRDEKANVELAARIVAESDRAAVRELAANIGNAKVASDIIKVLYEVAERAPELAAEHVGIFLELLGHKSNRIVWGAMTAVDAVAHLDPGVVFGRLESLREIANSGSVITRDHYVGIVIKLASNGFAVGAEIAEQFESCPSNQLPMYAERGFEAIRKIDAKRFALILGSRIGELKTESRRKRVEKVIQKLGK